MNAQQEEDDYRIIMFLFLAQGHIIPFLALAERISHRKPNTKITLVTTPLNIKYLEPTLITSETIYKNISLAALPFSATDHELPPYSEITDSLPSHLIANLLYALETLKPSFDNLITQIITTEKRVPACISSGISLGWVNEIAKRIGTYHFSFTTGGGYGTAMYFSMYLYHPHRQNDDGSNHITEEFLYPNSPLPYLREESPCAKYFQKQISLPLKSDGMLCNTVEEIEVLGLEILRYHMGSKPVWNIDDESGSVVSNLRTGKEFGISPEGCIEWLNHQNHLQLSEWLPDGFSERIKESQKGLLVKKWAPQLEILPQVNSVQGVPIIGWPLAAEQCYNSKMMEEEMGVCMELARGNEGELSREDVKKIIELDSCKGEEMRKKAMVNGEKIRAAMTEDKGEGDHQKGSSVRSVDNFLATVTVKKLKV
ncbi:hypothetical protein MKX01_016690 [Papaver californicum]|nr:hypothetical protein MKX01_016690 [Papaver californicum]